MVQGEDEAEEKDEAGAAEVGPAAEEAEGEAEAEGGAEAAAAAAAGDTTGRSTCRRTIRCGGAWAPIPLEAEAGATSVATAAV